MAQTTEKGGLDGGVAAAKQAPGRGLPPVHLWNPAHVGDLDIVITTDGRWVHEGAVISREALVRLFSTVLRKDPDGYCLVTPVEGAHELPFERLRISQLKQDVAYDVPVVCATPSGRNHYAITQAHLEGYTGASFRREGNALRLQLSAFCEKTLAMFGR